MSTGHLERTILAWGKYHRRHLVRCLVHRAFNGTDQVCLLRECGAVGQCPKLHVATFHETDADPLAAKGRSQFRGHGGRSRLEVFMLQRSRNEFQYRDQPRLAGKGLAAGKRFQPTNAPAQALHYFVHGTFRAAFEFYRGDAVEFVINQNRVRDENRILFARDAFDAVYGDLSLRQGAFDYGGKLRAAFDSLRPDCHGCEWRRLGNAQDDDAANGAVEGAALDIKPSCHEAAQVGRMR